MTLHEWYSDAGSTTEVDLPPGKYSAPSCTVDRVKRDPPLRRSDYPEICDLEWPAIVDRGPTETVSPQRVSKDGAFTIRRPGTYRITRPAGVSTLTQVE
jgi:hypothetical protein